MVDPRIDSTFDFSAAFWTPGEALYPLTGTLSANRGRLRFVTSPSYTKMDVEESRKGFLALGANVSVATEVLHGRVPDYLCTLFHLSLLDEPGVIDFRDNTRLSSQRFTVAVAVLGLHLSSMKSDEINGARFFFTGIRDWLTVPLNASQSDGKLTIIQPNSPIDIFKFFSPQLQCEVVLQLSPRNRYSRRDGTNLRHVPSISVVPTSPRSVAWFADLAPRLENYLALILGTSVAVKRVKLEMAGQSGWLVHNALRRTEKSNLQSVVRTKPQVLSDALSTWLAKPEAEQPVEGMLLGVIRKSNLFQETKFLSLAQAFEAMGRIKFKDCLVEKAQFKKSQVKLRAELKKLWGDSPIVDKSLALLAHANEWSFAQRLSGMYDLLSPEFAESLVGEKKLFTQAVVQTRNYHTHPGIKKGGSVVSGGKNLFIFNQKLAAFLRCVMLIDLGFPEEDVREPIRYQAQKWQ